jgi:uncharacterized protein (TIGR00290 family)
MSAVVLWTGGKDSALALYRARDMGIDVERLVTFRPVDASTPFLAHPIDDIRRAAEMVGIPHECVPVGEPYREGYVSALHEIGDAFGIDTVVTGDIAPVNALPNWIAECCESACLKFMAPLWECRRDLLLREVVDRGISARISWINSPHIPPSWLGRTIDEHFIDDIQALACTSPIDICGENGEYHTTVEHVRKPA